MTPGDDPSPPPRPGLRIGWMVLALLVAGLLVGGWFILDDQNRPVAGRPTVPPMVGGSGSFTDRTHYEIPGAPGSSTPFPPGTGAPITERPAEDFEVAGVGNNRIIECADHAVSVSGVHNTVTLTGHCDRVDVSGVENTVVIDSADAIDLSGINNKVTFHAGAPQLNDSGLSNTLERG